MVAFLDHPAGTLSTAAQINRLVRSRPEVIYLPDYWAEAGLVAREARAQGFKGVFMGGDGWDSPLLAGPRGLDAGYFTCNFAADENRPSVQYFVQKYRQRFRAEPDACAALAYDAANVLFDAIRRAGATRGLAFNAALANTSYPGVSGWIEFDPQRNPSRPPLVIEVKGGRKFCRGAIAP
jgi:branched-chain amino acid transport system substrate-binding protein